MTSAQLCDMFHFPGGIIVKNFVILLLLLSFLACRGDKENNAVNVAAKRPAKAVSSNPVLTAAPGVMLKVVKNKYRLKPDQRLLKAIGKTHHILTSRKEGEATANLASDGQWILKYGDAVVGKLPEYPDFSDYKALLSGWIEAI